MFSMMRITKEANKEDKFYKTSWAFRYIILMFLIDSDYRMIILIKDHGLSKHSFDIFLVLGFIFQQITSYTP